MPDGTWFLEQYIVNSEMAGDAIFYFPIAYKSNPIVQITASSDNGTPGIVKECFANYVRTSLTPSQMQLSVWELDTSLVTTPEIVITSKFFDIHVTLAGIVDA